MLVRGTYNIQQGGTLQRPGPAVSAQICTLREGTWTKKRGNREKEYSTEFTLSCHSTIAMMGTAWCLRSFAGADHSRGLLDTEHFWQGGAQPRSPSEYVFRNRGKYRAPTWLQGTTSTRPPPHQVSPMTTLREATPKTDGRGNL